MRVLVSAYACEPGKGSEPEAGFAFVFAAAEVAQEVVVLTRTNNRQSLRSVAMPSNVSFHFHDLGPVSHALKRLIPGGTQLYYLAWQLTARRIVRALHAARPFDLTHHVTFAVDYMPVASKLSQVPHVWGPVGGVTGLPWRMWRSQGCMGLGRESLREAVTRALRLVWGRRVAREAATAIAQNLDVHRFFSRYSNRLIVRPNVAVERVEVAPLPADVEPHFGGELRSALFVGRLIPHKGLRFAIEALAHPEVQDWQLLVVGDGPERKAGARLAQCLGIADRVVFLGHRERSLVGQLMWRADALLSASMYEGSGFAIAEAVSYGLPVVATRRGGSEVMVPIGAGELIPVTKTLAKDLASGLARVKGRLPTNDMWSRAELNRFVRQAYQGVLG